MSMMEVLFLSECTNCGTQTDLIKRENVNLCPLCIIDFYERVKNMGN